MTYESFMTKAMSRPQASHQQCHHCVTTAVTRHWGNFLHGPRHLSAFHSIKQLKRNQTACPVYFDTHVIEFFINSSAYEQPAYIATSGVHQRYHHTSRCAKVTPAVETRGQNNVKNKSLLLHYMCDMLRMPGYQTQNLWVPMCTPLNLTTVLSPNLTVKNTSSGWLLKTKAAK